MRGLSLVLALIGVAGIVFGVMDMVGGLTGPHAIPFQFENYGGPGPILGGLLLLACAIFIKGPGKQSK